MELRMVAVKYARERMAVGTAIEEVARELRTAPATLQRWMESAEASFRSVELVASPAVWVGKGGRPALSLLTPRGFRLEGLDVVTAAHLVQLLG
jgi:hypothetical protein